jgi:hypothetical protein
MVKCSTCRLEHEPEKHPTCRKCDGSSEWQPNQLVRAIEGAIFELTLGDDLSAVGAPSSKSVPMLRKALEDLTGRGTCSASRREMPSPTPQTAKADGSP